MNPFATDPRQAISTLGESALIEKLRQWLEDATPPSPHGMGDDCAVLPPPTEHCQQLVTADPIIYGRHFDDALSPQQCAAKLLRRNLSDIAAMGGRPRHAVLSLALAPTVSIPWMESFYTAIGQEARCHQLTIVGGDVSSADNFLGAFLTLYGETLPHTGPLLRKLAQDGSPVFVTGALGGTRIQKHWSFTPRLAEGQWLATRGDCLSCSDLSDGLGKDYANILPSALACEIDCERLPIADDARLTAERSGLSPLYHAFNDGEDFELIFALAPGADLNAFKREWTASFATPLRQIGTAVPKPSTESPSLILRNAPENFAATGYAHLR